MFFEYFFKFPKLKILETSILETSILRFFSQKVHKVSLPMVNIYIILIQPPPEPREPREQHPGDVRPKK